MVCRADWCAGQMLAGACEVRTGDPAATTGPPTPWRRPLDYSPSWDALLAEPDGVSLANLHRPPVDWEEQRRVLLCFAPQMGNALEPDDTRTRLSLLTSEEPSNIMWQS